MNRFIETPNLPSTRVTTLIAGKRYKALLSDRLAALGISALWMPDVEKLPPPVRGHTDLSVLHVGGNRFLAAGELPGSFTASLAALGARVGQCTLPLGNTYPDDCRLNAAVFAEHVILNPGISAFVPPSNMTPVKVKQGYARCSVCIVDGRSFITSDAGICRAAARAGMDVLLISEGNISLEGYNTGFIGGCAFKLSQDRIAFTGALRHHPDGERIFEFLTQKRVEPIFLSDGPLLDIGGAVLVLEEAPSHA